MNIGKEFCLGAILAVLAACGGGGGSGDRSDTPLDGGSQNGILFSDLPTYDDLDVALSNLDVSSDSATGVWLVYYTGLVSRENSDGSLSTWSFDYSTKAIRVVAAPSLSPLSLIVYDCPEYSAAKTGTAYILTRNDDEPFILGLEDLDNAGFPMPPNAGDYSDWPEEFSQQDIIMEVVENREMNFISSVRLDEGMSQVDVTYKARKINDDPFAHLGSFVNNGIHRDIYCQTSYKLSGSTTSNGSTASAEQFNVLLFSRGAYNPGDPALSLTYPGFQITYSLHGLDTTSIDETLIIELFGDANGNLSLSGWPFDLGDTVDVGIVGDLFSDQVVQYELIDTDVPNEMFSGYINFNIDE